VICGGYLAPVFGFEMAEPVSLFLAAKLTDFFVFSSYFLREFFIFLCYSLNKKISFLIFGGQQTSCWLAASKQSSSLRSS
jgi:hypothetical protein